MTTQPIPDHVKAIAANLFPPPPRSFSYPWDVDNQFDHSLYEKSVAFNVWFCLVVELHRDEPSDGPLWSLFRLLSPFGLVATYRRKGEERDDQREMVFAFKSELGMQMSMPALDAHYQSSARLLAEPPVTHCFTSVLDWRYVAAVFAESPLHITPALRGQLLARSPRQWMTQTQASDSLSGPNYREVAGDISRLIEEQGQRTQHAFNVLDIFDG